MTAEVRFLNLHSNLWREHDTEPYMKCVFFNTDKVEFVFTDLNDSREETMCVFLTKEHEVRYLSNREAAEKIYFWLQTRQDTLVARQDEMQSIMEKLSEDQNVEIDLMADEIKHQFVPIEL